MLMWLILQTRSHVCVYNVLYASDVCMIVISYCVSPADQNGITILNNYKVEKNLLFIAFL